MIKGFFPHWAFYFRSLKFSDHFLSLCVGLVTETLHPLGTGGFIASLFYFVFQVFRGCQHRMMSLYLSPEVRGGCWLGRGAGRDGGAQGWEWHLLWGSPCTGAGLASVTHHQRMPLKSFCRVPPLWCLSVCALQKSYSRNYFEFYLALWDYFWLLCATSQVIPGLCRVEGWHRGHESQEDLRRRQCCPPKESCFL